MGVRAALIAGGLLVLGAVLGVGLSSADSQSGSNRLTAQEYVATIPPGGTLCQRETVPAPTGGVRMTVATFGRREPAVELAVRDGERVVSRGGLRAGAWRQGVVTIPLRALRTRVDGGALCLRNPSRGRLAVGGERVGPFARVGGRDAPGRAAVVYLLPGDRSWFAAAGDVVGRFGFGRAELLGGSWTLWAALLALAVACGAAVRALAAREPSA